MNSAAQPTSNRVKLQTGAQKVKWHDDGEGIGHLVSGLEKERLLVRERASSTRLLFNDDDRLDARRAACAAQALWCREHVHLATAFADVNYECQFYLTNVFHELIKDSGFWILGVA